MKSTRFATYGPLVMSMSLLALPAVASDDCDTPTRQWQSRDAVMQMAAQQGWQVQRLKIDDGCYELRGRDAQGQSFKATIDPQTLSVVKMKLRDRDHDSDRDSGRRRERTRGAPSPDAGAGDQAPPSPGGSRATIE